MIKLIIHNYNLQLKNPFRITHVTRTEQPTMIVELKLGSLSGFGEATPISYYGLNISEMVKTLEGFKATIEKTSFEDPSQFFNSLEPYLKNHPFIQCAVDEAAHDLYGKIKNKPLYELWGLENINLPLTNYTIGLGSIEEMIEKIKAMPWPIYKIKVGTPQDSEIIEKLRSITSSIFRIDANTGWNSENTLQLAHEMKNFGVEFIEQPLKVSDHESMEKIKSECPLPLIADESCQVYQDVERCKNGFHGINIKLMKCGGITPALKMIKKARQLGLRVMIGCMTESSIGIAAIGQLLPLLDYVDMDGPLLIQNDPGKPLKMEFGKVFLSDAPGTGADLI
jgi:L-alanine-DL-glutamate epimerase-like enolase superfamily enzyme